MSDDAESAYQARLAAQRIQASQTALREEQQRDQAMRERVAEDQDRASLEQPIDNRFRLRLI